MCEFLENYVEKQLNPAQLGQVLHSTLLNINPQHLDLTYISIKALGSIITQTGDNFSNKEQRDFIMQGICKAANIPKEDIAEAAL